jgi:hypothetical protein
MIDWSETPIFQLRLLGRSVIQFDGCGLQVTFCISVGMNAYGTTAIGASSNRNNFSQRPA